MIIIEEAEVSQDELDVMTKQLRTLSKDLAGHVLRSSEPWYSVGAKWEEGEGKVNAMLHGKKTRRYTPDPSYTSDGAQQSFLTHSNAALHASTPSVLVARRVYTIWADPDLAHALRELQSSQTHLY